MRCPAIWVCALLAACIPALAQQSANHRIERGTLAVGGSPQDGWNLASTSFRITLSCLGEDVVGTAVASASHRVDGGFVTAYPPPGEVADLVFADPSTLEWRADVSAGVYNLYRDTLERIDVTYGTCEQSEIPDTTVVDTDFVPAGNGFFYLVTVENRLGEEGPKGTSSNGLERPNLAPCP